jgi:hypothetical protein
MKSLRVRSVAAAAVLLTAGAATVQVHAAENGLQRYSPGIGGSDMTSPLVPGWYFQLPVVAYHASKMKGNDGQIATNATPVGQKVVPTSPTTTVTVPAQPDLRSRIDAKADNQALLPRLTYLGTDRFWGANVGFTAMLPLVRRKATFAATPDFTNSTVPGGFQPSYAATIQGLVGSQNGSQIGLGDAEISPVLHWEIGDHQAVTFAPTLVLPTGDYKATQRVNTGYGNFFTFRPSVQYAFIGDGWDIGARSVFSFNTRNKDDGYYSGHVFNLDYQAMAFVSDDIRVGLQGYFVRQLSADTQDLSGFTAPQVQAYQKEIINGNKISVNAAGPAVAWLKNGGEMLVEGKFLKEFNARNRFEGAAFWLTVSKPL